MSRGSVSAGPTGDRTGRPPDDPGLARHPRALLEVVSLTAGGAVTLYTFTTYALFELPEMERTVLAMRYFDELSLEAIARVFAVTESRISQIHAKAIARLRKWLAPADLNAPRGTPSVSESRVARSGMDTGRRPQHIPGEFLSSVNVRATTIGGMPWAPTPESSGPTRPGTQ